MQRGKAAMEESKGKLIVSVSDSHIPMWEYTHKLVEHVNGLQNEIEVTTDQGSHLDLMVHILERGEAQPYTFEANVASISTAFWRTWGITASTLDYITYFLSIVLLEFLYQRETREPIVMFPKLAYRDVNEHVWLGVLPRAVQDTASDMAGISDEMRLLIRAIEQIRNGNLDRRMELGTRARQVADRIGEIGLPGISDPVRHLQDVFIHSKQDRVKEVVRAINTEEQGALRRLAELVADCPRREAKELLKSFAEVPGDRLAPYGISDDYFAELGVESDVQITQMVNQIARWVEQRSLQEGAEIMPDIRDVVQHSNPESVAKVVKALNTGRSGADSDLIDMIAKCTRPSARSLLETLKAAGDRGTGILAREALETHEVIDDPQPDPPPPTPETATTGFFGIDSDAEAPEDALGYRDYAKALAATICDKTTGTPFTLGICAPWGRGKSSLMRFVEEEVGKLSRLNRNTHEPVSQHHKPSLCVRFDAWKYSKADHVWAGFMDVVLKEVERSLSRWQKVKLAYRLNKSRDLPLIRNLWIFLLVFASLAVSAVLSPIFLFGDDQWSGIGHWLWSIPALIILTGLSYRKFLSSTWKLLNHPLTERIIGLTSMPDYTQRLDPVHRIVGDIRVVLNEFQDWTGVDRFVVFIDDIDRCKPGKIMEVLEAIKHFLDLSGFVFLIAMDTRVVRLAIGEHYRFMGEKLQLRQDMGRFYLEKMIQVPFHLPELSPSQRLSLNEKILARHRKEIIIPMKPATLKTSPQPATVSVTSDSGEVPEPRSEDVSESNASLRSGITTQEDDIIKELLKNEKFDISPRLLKRFINVYMIARHILITERERASISAEKPIPKSFIKWLAVSVRYPWGTRALLRWLEVNDWHSPFSLNQRYKNPVFGKNGRFLYRESKLKHLEDTAWTVPAQEPFDNMRISDMDRFGRLLVAMAIDWNEVRDTLHITNCFNLVSD